MPALTLSDLTKTYAASTDAALRSLTLTVPNGDLLALLGPSGSGKSTALKLIAGIETPDRGDVQLDGVSLLPVPAHQRNTVLMFQKPYLFPFLSVFDNIAFGLRVRRMPAPAIERAVGELLALVGLPGYARRKPTELSGGEQQRIALARALVVEPRLLLLDEPFSSLDPAVRADLQQAVRAIQQQRNLTTVLVTHDLSEAILMADQIALLQRGALIAHAPPRALFERPPTRAAAEFVGISTFFTGTVAHDVLHIEQGPLAVPPASGPAHSTTYAIRPEHIQLRPTPTTNSWPATVHHVRYRGETTEIIVSAQGQEFIVRVPPSAAPIVGDDVYVVFPVDALFEVM